MKCFFFIVFHVFFLVNFFLKFRYITFHFLIYVMFMRKNIYILVPSRAKYFHICLHFSPRQINCLKISKNLLLSLHDKFKIPFKIYLSYCMYYPFLSSYIHICSSFFVKYSKYFKQCERNCFYCHTLQYRCII